jgi:urease accessory protein
MSGYPPLVPGADRLTGFLAALQLTDSAFPSGRYTLSYGLETLVRSGRLGTPAERSTLTALLADYLRLAVAPSDGVGLACAHRATGCAEAPDLDLIIRADRRLTAVKLPMEARRTSRRTGRALLRVATAALTGPTLAEYADTVASGRTPGNHAVVLGVLSASLGVPRLAAVAGELFAFAASWVASAVRLAATDHVTAQAILAEIRPVLAEAAMDTVDLDVAWITSCAPLLDVMAMRHEESDLRLFAS